MMSISKEFEALALTVRLNGLFEKSKKIGDIIVDLPIVFFPKQQNELIELAEEEYELATRLYQIYIDNQEFSRAALVINGEQMIEESLFILKKPICMM